MATQITYGPAAHLTTKLVETGAAVEVYTATGSITGTFVSLSAAKGIRVKADGKYLTRKLDAVTHVEILAAEEVSDEDVAAELPAPAPAPVDDAAAASLRAMEVRAGGGRRRGRPAPVAAPVEDTPAAPAAAPVEETPEPELTPEQSARVDRVVAALDKTFRDRPAAPAAAPVEGPAAPAAEVTDVFDADPMVDGRRLSEMKFPEVMVLAKKYRTPGRGVARIVALREGVAKAIHAEVSTRIAADAALRG